MNLSVFDRDVLTQIIPPDAGSLAEMRAAVRLRRRLALTPEEQAAIAFVAHPDGTSEWDGARAAAVVLEVDVAEYAAVVEGGFALYFERAARYPTGLPFHDLCERLEAEGLAIYPEAEPASGAATDGAATDGAAASGDGQTSAGAVPALPTLSHNGDA